MSEHSSELHGVTRAEVEQQGDVAAPIVAILGAGSWGSAMAHLMLGKGAVVRVWARDSALLHELRETGENRRYLPGASLRGAVFCDNLESALENCDCIVSALPCAATPGLTAKLRALLPSRGFVVSGTKGLHPEGGERASQMWEDGADLPPERFVALSGPNLAREIVAGVPTSTVVASASEHTARAAQGLFGAPHFRVYTNPDVLGVELGGALKNVVAIAAGMGDGLGFGDNAKGALVARAWREMTRLGTTLGAHPETLWGLSGMGDLLATCVSPHSRNRKLGELLARGLSLAEAQREIGQVAEGVHTARAALKLAEENSVELPVTEQVARVLWDGVAPREAVSCLMTRRERSELE